MMGGISLGQATWAAFARVDAIAEGELNQTIQNFPL